MTPEKKKKLEAAEYAVGDYQDFLGLTDEEVKLIDLRLVWRGQGTERDRQRPPYDRRPAL